jgi:hypothetical protein
MRYIYSVLIFLAATISVDAQRLNEQTITIAGDPADIIETGVIRVTNNSANNYSVKVRRRVGDVSPNSSNYFCWTVCYGSGTDVSPAPLTINSNSYNDSFHGYLVPNGDTTMSVVTYVFFNAANANDSVWFRVNYVPNGIADALNDPHVELSFPSSVKEIKEQVVSHGYPNPAKEQISFDITRGEKVERVEVVNLLGVKVSQQNLTSQSKVVINVNGLSEGIYFCNFYNEGNVVGTQRFIVTR